MNAVEQANPQHDFYYFEQNCENYGWDDPLAAEGSYCATHGVAELAGNIGHFLGYYVPRKMSTPSQSEMRRMCSALRALIRHCVDQGHMTKADAKPILKRISTSSNFRAEKIQRALNQLHTDGYWNALEGANDGEYDRSIRPGFPLELHAVRADGWDFEYSSPYDSDGHEELISVPLPADLARLGKPGASFSCMGLARRGGVWSTTTKWWWRTSIRPPTSPL